MPRFQCMGRASKFKLMPRMVKYGTDTQSAGGCRLIYTHSAIREIWDAHKTLFVLPHHNVVAWNFLMASYSSKGMGKEALGLFCSLNSTANLKPTERTFCSVLTACRKSGLFEQSKGIHGLVWKFGFNDNVYIGNALIDLYGKWGYIMEARQVFDKMAEPNFVSWTSIITVYAQNGFGVDAFEMFKKMIKENVGMDEYALNSVISTLSGPEGLAEGRQLHCFVINAGFEGSHSVAAGLVNMYAKCKKMESSVKIFKENCDHQDLVSWNTLMSGYLQNGDFEQALLQFSLMIRSGIRADVYSFATALGASAALAVGDVGNQMHSVAIKTGFSLDVSVQNVLTTMLAKTGDIEGAMQVFNEMGKRNIISWNAVITACAQHGHGREVLDLFGKMIESGLVPDHVTFVGVLSACRHKGLLEEGFMYFEDMNRLWGITPEMEHYSCMVDLLGRAGHLAKAEDFISGMPLTPSRSVWKALLSSCRFHDEIEIGRRAAEKLLAFEDLDAACYVLLANFYFACGQLELAAKMRKLGYKRGVKKDLGCSWITVNKTVYAFWVGYGSSELELDLY